MCLWSHPLPTWLPSPAVATLKWYCPTLSWNMTDDSGPPCATPLRSRNSLHHRSSMQKILHVSQGFFSHPVFQRMSTHHLHSISLYTLLRPRKMPQVRIYSRNTNTVPIWLLWSQCHTLFWPGTHAMHHEGGLLGYVVHQAPTQWPFKYIPTTV